ncbi:hypothetical protein ABIB42_002047 [Massilia sp. UYP32]|jgi:hypothetical protein|uniref:hypothetical protein n=1 Tax=Massilia TaxID=149698 RepID=UPI000D9AA157|nr:MULTISPECIES: hypothetical protein [Massilia]QYG01438.1 hypothetical protein KY496_24505 [Massilia sp. NP310]
MSHPFARTVTQRWDIQAYIAVAVVALAMWASTPANAQSQDKSVIGQWRLTAVLDSSQISALDDAQANGMIGQVLSIGANRVRLGKRICDAPTFEATRAETEEYLYRHANASAENLGLPNPVTVVNLDCMDVYQKPPDKLVVHWQGVFFDAVRERPRRQK